MISIRCPLISYISHAILPLFSLSFPDSFGVMSRPLLASISIPPLLFGCSFIEPCMFPVHEFSICCRLSFFNLVSTRIIKSSLLLFSFFSALSLFFWSPSPFTFSALTVICDMLFCCLVPFCCSVWLPFCFATGFFPVFFPVFCVWVVVEF